MEDGDDNMVTKGDLYVYLVSGLSMYISRGSVSIPSKGRKCICITLPATRAAHVIHVSRCDGVRPF